MKSFIKINKELQQEKPLSSELHFVPGFPGIYCDLNTTISPDDCDHYLGTTGLGSEFYIKANRISKMFIELLPYIDISFDNLNSVINLHEVTEFKDYAVSEINNLNQIYPSQLVFDLDWNHILIMYNGNTALDSFLKQNHIVKVNTNVSLWVNSETEALNGVFIGDFWRKIYSKGTIFKPSAIGTNRFESLTHIYQQFFGASVTQDEFVQLINKHQERKDTPPSENILKFEDETLQNLLALRKHLFWMYSIH